MPYMPGFVSEMLASMAWVELRYGWPRVYQFSRATVYSQQQFGMENTKSVYNKTVGPEYRLSFSLLTWQSEKAELMRSDPDWILKPFVSTKHMHNSF